MNARDLKIAGERRYFAISVTPLGEGPYIAPHKMDGHCIVPGQVTPHPRNAELFNAADADALLRTHPRYSVLQAVQCVDTLTGRFSEPQQRRMNAAATD
jgi:hypothetical protein